MKPFRPEKVARFKRLLLPVPAKSFHTTLLCLRNNNSLSSGALVPSGFNYTIQRNKREPEATSPSSSIYKSLASAQMTADSNSKTHISSEMEILLGIAKDYNILTIDLALRDPVIASSATQTLTENAQSILALSEGQPLICALHSRGFSSEAKIILNLLCVLYEKSDSIKLLSLRLLLDLMFTKASSLQNNKETIKYFVEILMKFNPKLSKHLGHSTKVSLSTLDAVPNTLNSEIYLTHYNLFKILILCCLLSQHPLLAASFYMSLIKSYHAQNSNFVNYLLLNNEMLHSIVTSLLILEPGSDPRNLVTVVKLLEAQNKSLKDVSHTWTNLKTMDLEQFKFRLSHHEQDRLLSNCLGLDDEPFLLLKIHVFEKIFNLQHHDIVNSENALTTYLRYSYQLIEANIKMNNDAMVYFVWSEIQKYHTKSYNSQIDSPNNNHDNNYYYYSVLSKLIKFFSKNKRYKALVDRLIENIPIQSCTVNPELMDALLMHSARNGDVRLSDILLQQLSNDDQIYNNNHQHITHLSRGQLSALLALHLEFQDTEGVEKIVSLIYERFSTGLDHVEINLICKRMLAKTSDDFRAQKVWKMFESLSPFTGKSLATLLIDHMIETRNMEFDKIEDIFSKLVKNIKSTDEVWEWISALYIKYLTRNFPLTYAKKVYQASSQAVFYYDKASNPFSKAYNKARIYLPHRVKKVILKSIIDSSIFHKQDESITFWCLHELETLGFGYKEIILDLSLSKKEAKLKSQINFNALRKNEKDNTQMPLLALDKRDRNISAHFEKDIDELYLRYLSYRERNT